MIITCPNCNKQFKIDNYLIPDEGRDLLCGSCNHFWFYKIEEENTQALKLNEELESKYIEKKDESKKEKREKKTKQLQKTNTQINNEKISENQKNKNTSKNIENKGSKFLSFLIVFIISLVALVILLDTLKTKLIYVENFTGQELKMKWQDVTSRMIH